MLLIPCPHCGPRDETEFRYGSEGGVALPADEPSLDDPAWGQWVFVRSNPKGPLTERWYHVHGCRRWFALRRDTATDEILSGPTPIGWPRPPRGTAVEPGSAPEPPTAPAMPAGPAANAAPTAPATPGTPAAPAAPATPGTPAAPATPATLR